MSVFVNGLESLHAGRATALLNMKIRSFVDTSFVLEINALVLKHLTGLLPSIEITMSCSPRFIGLQPADPEYYRPGDIDMLSASDEECDKHFSETHSRDCSDRYVVRLPFKSTVGQLGKPLRAKSRVRRQQEYP